MTNQPWIILALVCAFSLATSDALTKKAVSKDNELMIAWLRIFLAFPVLVVYQLFSPLPQVDSTFFLAYFTALPLEILAIVLYIKALRLSPLSMTLPFQSLTPLFLIFFSRIIAGDKVTGTGAAGIFLIVIGGYTLNIGSIRKGFLEPFKAIARERGSVYMILVALIYSVTSSLGKVAVVHSSPSFFAASYYLGVIVSLLPLVLVQTRPGHFVSIFGRTIRLAILPGMFLALMAITHYAAISLGNVAYVIAIKRSSLLIGSLYGFLFFKEGGAAGRLTGALLMFSGFSMIVFAIS